LRSSEHRGESDRVADVGVDAVLDVLEHFVQVAGACGTQEARVAVSLTDHTQTDTRLRPLASWLSGVGDAKSQPANNEVSCRINIIASTPALVVPPSRLSTVGDRAFPVAAARVWNSLSDFVTASTSLPMFKRHLKTVLFAKSY